MALRFRVENLRGARPLFPPQLPFRLPGYGLGWSICVAVPILIVEVKRL